MNWSTHLAFQRKLPEPGFKHKDFLLCPGHPTRPPRPPPPPPPTQCRPLNSDEYLLLQVQGRVSYNGQSFNSFQVPRTAAYVQQTDSHMAQLTVRETFDFAARVQGIGCQGGEDLAKVKPGRPYDSMMRWNVLVTCPVMAACS